MDITLRIRHAVEGHLRMSMQRDVLIKHLTDGLKGLIADGFYTRKFLNGQQQKDGYVAWS